MKRIVTSLFLTILVLGLASFEFSAVAANENSKPFTVVVKGQAVSIEAKNASALEVLKNIGEKAGIEVRVFEGVEDKTISLNLKDYPLGEMTGLLKKVDLNYVYGHEGDANHMIVYVLSEGKKEGNRGVSLGSPPQLETVWFKEFEEGVPVGVGSPDGRVVLLDTKSDKSRYKLVAMDENRDELWSKSFNLLQELAATPSWEKIIFSIMQMEGYIPDEKGSNLPGLAVEVYNRDGTKLGSSILGHGLVYATNETLLWNQCGEGGCSGNWKAYGFSGGLLNSFGMGFNHSVTLPNGDGILSWGPKSAKIVDVHGNVKFESPKLRGTIYGSKANDNYLLTGDLRNDGMTYYHFYNYRSGEEIISFAGYGSGDFALSPDRKRLAIVTYGQYRQQVFFYEMEPARLLKKYDLTAELQPILFLAYDPGTEMVESPENGKIRFDGEWLYVLGKEREGQLWKSTGKYLIGCWDINGDLIWKTALGDGVKHARFSDLGAENITLWNEKGVAQIKIK